MADDLNFAKQPFGQLRLQALTNPNGLFYSDAAQSITFADALKLSTQIASKLRSLGVKPGQIISLDMAVGLQVLFIEAAFHEGAITCPSLPTQPKGEGLQVDWHFSSNGSTKLNAKNNVVVDGAFLAEVQRLSTDIESIDYPSQTSVCRLCFSSGTTGTPKAIAFTLEMVQHRSKAAYKLFNEGQPFMSLLDLGTASGFHTFYASVAAGVAYINPGSGEYNLSQIKSRKVSAVKASPAHLIQLFNAAVKQGVRLDELANIHSVGSALPVKVREAIRANSNARIFNLYGSTEVGRAAERELTDNEVSFAGIVVDETKLQIVDENDVELPFGELGLVRYQSAFQANEYFGDVEATKKGFKDGWFYTGDTGRVTSDGRLTLEGRSSEIINAGGVKIDPVKIENWILENSKVSECAGFGFEAEGSNVEFVMAVVADDSVNLAALIDSVSHTFGSLAPRAFFKLPQLPRSGAGKILRRELAELYRNSIAGK